MIRLIVKIFLAYWLAAGLVILAVNFGPHQHMHIHELADALYASMNHDAEIVLRNYSQGGCTPEMLRPDRTGSRIGLASSDGTVLCGSFSQKDTSPLVREASQSKRIEVSSFF